MLTWSNTPPVDHTSPRTHEGVIAKRSSCRDDFYISDQTRRDRLYLIHVLRLKALAVAKIEQFIVRQFSARHVVERGVANHDTNVVTARFQQFSDIEFVRRAPK